MKRYILPILKIFLFLIFYYFIVATFSFINAKLSRSSNYAILDLTSGSTTLIAAFLAVWVFLKIRKKNFNDIGMNTVKDSKKKFAFGAACGAAVPVIIIAISIILGDANITGLNITGAGNIIFVLIKGILLYLFLYGITQEMVYRGFIYHYFKTRFTIAGAAILTSIIFALLNLFRTDITINSFFNIFLLGIILNLFVIKDKEIWGALGFSFSWNYITSVIFSTPGGIFSSRGIIGVSLKSYSLISGGNFGILGGIITSIVLAAIIIYVVKKYDEFAIFVKGMSGNKNFAIMFLIIASTLFSTGTNMYEQFKSVDSDKKPLNKIAKFSAVNNYKMDLSFNAGDKILSGSQIVEYINKSGNQLNEIYFHIYPNAYKKNKGSINIKSVSINKTSADFKIEGKDRTLLKIKLNQKLLPGKIASIKINYKISIPGYSENNRFGYGENTYNLGNFFPIAAVYKNGEWDKHLYDKNGDAFYSEISNFDVSISAPKNQVIACSGEAYKVVDKDGKKIWKMRAYGVRDFAFVSSSKFITESAKVNGVNIKSYAFNKEKAKDVLKYSINAMKLFDKKFGIYPYPSCSVVESDLNGGMEYPNLVMISSSAYSRQLLTSLVSIVMYGSPQGGLEDIVAHELAHQWWYGLVGNDEYREAWIDEPLAQYSALQYFKKYYSKEIYELQYNFNKGRLKSFMKSKGYKQNPSMNRPLNKFNETEYNNIIYNKGMFMLDALNKEIGDKKFNLFLETLYNKYKFKEITGKEFIQLTSQVAGKDMSGFYHKWLEEK